MFNSKLKTEITKIRKELAEDLKRGTEIMTMHSEKLAELKQYVECSVCGCLVNKEKATMKQEMRNKNKGEQFLSILRFVAEGKESEPEKEIVKVYTCPRCLKSKKK